MNSNIKLKPNWSRPSSKRSFVFSTSNVQGKTEYQVSENGQTLITVREDLIRHSQDEVESWYEYLNLILGLTSFGFAVAVQGTPNPPFNAFICLVFLLISHFAFNLNKFPTHLRKLRQNDEAAYRFLAKKIEGIQLSIWQTVKRAPLFLIGYLYLLLLVVMALNPIQSLMIFDHTLADIFLPKDCVCRFPGK